MNPTELKISIYVESYDKPLKITETTSCRKAHSYKTIEDINYKF